MRSSRPASPRLEAGREASRYVRTLRARGLGLGVIGLLLSSAAQQARAQSTGRDTSTPEASTTNANRPREQTILLVRTSNDEGVMNRVRAELGASAGRISELRLDERSAQVPLAELALRQQARAAVRFNAAEGRVELWVYRPSGSTDETLDASGERGDDAVLALRISEALRARGLALGPETDAGSSSVPVSPRSPVPAAKGSSPVARRRETALAEEAKVEGSRKALWLSLALAVSGSTSEPSASLDAFGSARWEFGTRWACSLLGVIPVVPPRVEGPEGSARIATTLLGAAAEATWLSAPSLRLGAGLGGFGSRTHMSGAAASGYRGSDESVFALGPFGRMTARLRVSDRVWLGTSVLGGFSFPEVSVKFADRVAGRWGRPLLMATLGVEVEALRFSGASAVRPPPAGK